VNVASIAVILGDEWPDCIHKDKEWFWRRGCFIDARGHFEVHEEAIFGYGVKVLTASHDISKGEVGPTILKSVIVGNAWIGSFSLLYNCIIHDGAIVASGAVVKSCEVMPNTMVAGNPAQVIARRIDDKWIYLVEKWRRLE
jgi:acetyltransferase-like isoleucine patch superfamily enzyme